LASDLLLGHFRVYFNKPTEIVLRQHRLSNMIRRIKIVILTLATFLALC